MKKLLIFTLLALVAMACGDDSIKLVSKENMTYYVESTKASMRLTIKGNTASKVMMIIVHGGPGGTAFFYRSDAMIKLFESTYSVAYWDQRNAGSSQGTDNKEFVTIDQMGDDLKKVVEFIKYQYGNDMQVFIFSQSWGGMVASSFITKPENQELISGWFFVNASHNYPLNDSLTSQKLISFGQNELASGRNNKDWDKIVNFCLAHAQINTFDLSAKLNAYAWDAMELIEGFETLNEDDILNKIKSEDHIPITAAFSNLYSPGNKQLAKEAFSRSFAPQLKNVTVPVLVCSGGYDFVTPEGLGDEVFSKVSSEIKVRRFFDHSGHNLEEQENYINALLDFILMVK